MAQMTTYDIGWTSKTGTLGNREDLLDVVTNLDRQLETPFFTTSAKGTCKDVEHGWLIEALQAASTAGALEGAVFTAGTMNARTRINNFCQIFRKDVQVTDTQRAVDPAGVADEYTHQIELGLKEIARNVESTVFMIATGGVSGGAATARQMKGIRGFTGTAGTGINGGLATNLVLDLHQALYNNGANPDVMYVSPAQKRAWTAAVAAASAWGYRNIAAADSKGILNIDVFESDFGLVAVVPDRFVPNASVSTSSAAIFLFERSKARLDFLRPLKHTPVGKLGDSTAGMVLGELTFVALHPSCFGVGTGVTA